MSILATELDWPEGTKFFEVRCRLGIWDVDGWDLDKEPEVKTLGGTVRITPRTPAGRIRILEPDGRYRVVVTPPLTFAINEFTGRLVNTADNTEGVWVVDPSSDTVDPKDFTYSAVVTPKVGSPFTVEFDGTVAINGVYDLANGTTVAPSRGVSVLESRIAKLETEVGQTVREVSGTVTLTPADGPLVQVYATAAATVNGESLMIGDVAVFRLVAGKWEVRVLDVDTSGWRVVGTAPVQPTDPEAVAVTASAPTWKDDDENGGGTWSVPAIEGVTYNPVPYVAGPGETVTVRASAMTGYKLSGVASWTHTFSRGPVKPVTDAFITDSFDAAREPVGVVVQYRDNGATILNRTTDTGGVSWKLGKAPTGTYAVYSYGAITDGALNTTGRTSYLNDNPGLVLEAGTSSVMLEVDYDGGEGAIYLDLAYTSSEWVTFRRFGSGSFKVFTEKNMNTPFVETSATAASGALAVTYDASTGTAAAYIDGQQVVRGRAGAGRTGTDIRISATGGATLDNVRVTAL